MMTCPGLKILIVTEGQEYAVQVIVEVTEVGDYEYLLKSIQGGIC